MIFWGDPPPIRDYVIYGQPNKVFEIKENTREHHCFRLICYVKSKAYSRLFASSWISKWTLISYCKFELVPNISISVTFSTAADCGKFKFCLILSENHILSPLNFSHNLTQLLFFRSQNSMEFNDNINHKNNWVKKLKGVDINCRVAAKLSVFSAKLSPTFLCCYKVIFHGASSPSPVNFSHNLTQLPFFRNQNSMEFNDNINLNPIQYGGAGDLIWGLYNAHTFVIPRKNQWGKLPIFLLCLNQSDQSDEFASNL